MIQDGKKEVATEVGGGLQNENLCHEQVGWSREKIGAGYFFPQMNQKANYWLRGKLSEKFYLLQTAAFKKSLFKFVAV